MSHVPASNPMDLFRLPAVTPQDDQATRDSDARMGRPEKLGGGGMRRF